MGDLVNWFVVSCYFESFMVLVGKFNSWGRVTISLYGHSMQFGFGWFSGQHMFYGG